MIVSSRLRVWATRRMGSTPQWCEKPSSRRVSLAKGGFFTAARPSRGMATLIHETMRPHASGWIGPRRKDESRRVSTAERNGALCTQERLDVSLAVRVGILPTRTEPDARRRRHGRGRIVTVNCTERRQGNSKVYETEVALT